MATDARTNRLIFAAVSALTVLTWYAIPDAVRDRRARAAIKAGLLGVTALGIARIPDVYPEVGDLPQPRVDLPVPALAAAVVAVAAASTWGTVWTEKAIFAFGERRRAGGVRCAHTPLAAALAVASGALALVDWERHLKVTPQR